MTDSISARHETVARHRMSCARQKEQRPQLITVGAALLRYHNQNVSRMVN
jgi:hypothetical protein